MTGPLDVSHETSSAFTQSSESGILLRALGPGEHGIKRAVPSGVMPYLSVQICSSLGHCDGKIVLRKFGHRGYACELGGEVDE